jgi:hypothetical protein
MSPKDTIGVTRTAATIVSQAQPSFRRGLSVSLLTPAGVSLSPMENVPMAGVEASQPHKTAREIASKEIRRAGRKRERLPYQAQEVHRRQANP